MVLAGARRASPSFYGTLAITCCWMFLTSGIDYQETSGVCDFQYVNPGSSTDQSCNDRATTTEAVVASIRCQPSELRMGIGPPVSPETGEHPLLLTLTNEGPGACYLDGYPGVTLYDAEMPVPRRTNSTVTRRLDQHRSEWTSLQEVQRSSW